VFRHLLRVGVLLIVTAAPAYAQNSNYTLVQCDQGKSLQAAIDNTREAGTVDVTGTCNETVRIETDKLFLRGLGATVNGQPGTFAALQVTDGATGVRITGLSISGDAGVSIDNGSSATIWSTAIIATNNAGIFVSGASYARVYDSVVSSGGFGGVFIFNGSAAGIYNNTVGAGTGSAIGIQGGSSAVVWANTAANSYIGLHVAENSHAFLSSDASNAMNGNVFGSVCEFGGVIRVDVNQAFGGNTTNVVTSPTCEIRLASGVTFP